MPSSPRGWINIRAHWELARSISIRQPAKDRLFPAFGYRPFLIGTKGCSLENLRHRCAPDGQLALQIPGGDRPPSVHALAGRRPGLVN
jgi:hypothetical protein